MLRIEFRFDLSTRRETKYGLVTVARIEAVGRERYTCVGDRDTLTRQRDEDNRQSESRVHIDSRTSEAMTREYQGEEAGLSSSIFSVSSSSVASSSSGISPSS